LHEQSTTFFLGEIQHNSTDPNKETNMSTKPEASEASRSVNTQWQQ